MRNLVSLVLLVMLASHTGVCDAQGTKTPADAKRTFKHHGEIASKYDAQSNMTTVVLNPYRLTPSMAPESYSIMCGFTFKGSIFTGSFEKLEFHVISDSGVNYKFNKEKKRVLSATIDGEHIEIGVMKLLSSKHYAFGSDNSFVEHVYIGLTYQGLVKIANGKKVLLTIGYERIELETEPLEALRDLVSRMTPEARPN